MRIKDNKWFQSPFTYFFILIALACVIYFINNYSYLGLVTSYCSSYTLNLVGIENIIITNFDMTYILTNHGYVEIGKLCTGIEWYAVAYSFIIVTPGIARIKFKVALYVSIITFLTNILRVSITTYLLYYGIPFWIAHDLFNFTFILIIVILLFVIFEKYIPVLETFYNKLYVIYSSFKVE